MFVTEHNISNIFDYFCKKVVKDVEKIQANDLVAIFMGVITDPDEYYQHPNKKNVLVCKSTHLSINGDGFKSFFSYFNRNYTPQEKNKFAEISDRLIEDTNRRNKGEFYTPTPFADYAHKYMEEVFGENWKEEYVVWSCCCGTKNMTRDYYFKELYCSTLENAELQIGARYNKEATCFQMDFLNDDETKMPASLLQAMKDNKKIIFFINPPYATAASGVGKTKGSGVVKTKTNEEMNCVGLGGGAENLQHQFLYRICKFQEKYNLTDLHIGLFSKPIYLSGGKQAKFLDYLCDHFAFNRGFLFNASNFANCSDKWGITFNIWNTGKTTDKHNFVHSLVDFVDGDLEEVGEKNIYNVNGEKTASKWLRIENKQSKEKKVLMPHFSTPFKVNDKENQTLLEGSLGGFCALANNVCENAQGVIFTSAIQTKGTACITNSVTKDNFTKCTALFSARKLIIGNWINDKDEYLAPNEEHEKYQEFVNDSIIYSLFHSASNQSSLRQVDYKGKKWDIKNEFFFMSKEDIMSMADENHFDFTYNDAKVSSDRYVYNKLQGIELSAEAKAVLDKAIELTKASFKYRSLFNEEHPEYQILNWDCGWYQIKGMLKEYMPNELKEFTDLFKALADKMRPMVYELGFLK